MIARTRDFKEGGTFLFQSTHLVGGGGSSELGEPRLPNEHTTKDAFTAEAGSTLGNQAQIRYVDGKQASPEESSLGPVPHFLLGINCPETNIRGPKAVKPRRGS